MAVSKLWAVTSRLGQVIDYAANPEKTAADNYTVEQYQAHLLNISVMDMNDRLSLCFFSKLLLRFSIGDIKS